MEPRSDRWEYENFSIYHFAAEYLESDLAAAEVRQLMSDYEVSYDFDPHLYEDRLILEMVCEVNVDAKLPGYRFISLFLPEFKPLIHYDGGLSEKMIAAEDLEFFLKSAHLSVQDHIIGTSQVMPLGPYFLPPPDLDQNINDLLNEGVE